MTALITGTKKPCPTTNHCKVSNVTTQENVMTSHNIAPNNPKTQHQEFIKDTMKTNLDCTASKLMEMATLFALIQDLLKDDSIGSKHKITMLANLGQHSCESWSSTVETISERFIEDLNGSYH
ncbi:hypothetical protein [Acinetobacter pollinis]|uniref:hypothetical protein n=1 Tax=Acinetobacter pollinis TaxID=2605270 RepID=UPI0018C2E677|nr:hypothetical protein [Acinetobacter pollinis]MBF7694177.1 hypothetical protein [Acinetobacter pollinis]MBF7701748.1 hypothetical protein [Acinetobacter pollinis]